MSSRTPAGRTSAEGSPTGPSAGRRRPLPLLLGLAVGVQLVVLYSPESGGQPSLPGTDKLVHVLVFLVPVALALLAGLPRWLVLAVFGAHAVLSELVQGAFLPHRSGDPWDAVADLTGVALGVLVAHVYLRSRAARADGSRA